MGFGKRDFYLRILQLRIQVNGQTVPWYVTCSTESFSTMPDHQLIPELGYEFLTADQILKLGHKIWPTLSRLLKNKMHTR